MKGGRKEGIEKVGDCDGDRNGYQENCTESIGSGDDLKKLSWRSISAVIKVWRLRIVSLKTAPSHLGETVTRFVGQFKFGFLTTLKRVGLVIFSFSVCP